MLLHLSIKNFAIIKQTDISFRNGMTVVTGETGAGKSILLDALGFVLGARLEKTFLHEDESTEVSAIFNIEDNQKVKSLLESFFIEYDDECIIRRVVNKSGQSRIFINGTVSKATDVKQISDKLISIYSQNSHQDLLDSKTQLRLLDGFAHHMGLLESVRESFKAIKNIDEQVVQLQEIVAAQSSQRELLEYKLEELLVLDLVENEFDELEARQKSLSSVDEKMYSLNKICEAMNDSEQNIISTLSDLEKDLSKFTDHNELGNLQDLVSQIKIYAKESYDESRNILDNLESDPEQLSIIEQRMSIIYELARKHKIEPNYLYEYISEVQQELDDISNDNSRLDKLIKQRAILEKDYTENATKLSQSRQKASQLFSKEVEKNIRLLNIPKGSFVVKIERLENFTVNGFDSCEFMINFNLGENLAPIKKVASGGELSRIGLSIQAVSAEVNSYSTLVFDEVDVGISGATAEIVGKLLRKLSQKIQVLCITHQAQVASQGEIHLHVIKTYLQNTTESKIVELTAEQRVAEIAKIVGGGDISENTLKHAREMLGL